jgi:hypothetical protein
VLYYIDCYLSPSATGIDILFIDPARDHFIVSNELKVLPDRSLQEPGKWVIPVKHADHLAPDDIDRVSLLYMYKFMAYDLLQFRFRMQTAVDKNTIAE